MLNAIAKNVPWLLGGAADLNPSTKTLLTFEGAGNLQAETPGGRNMHFGVREHAMGGIINGMSLTKVRPYGAGFFIFSDYGRGSIRLGRCRKSRSFTSSRTIRSASARTAPRTSRSSTSPRCGRSRT